MSIDFDTFLDWAESRFGDVVISGSEIKVNSVFTDDYKHHMWCSPSGGKHQRPNGVYKCWKTGQFGSLVSLVCKVDNCSYEEAVEILGCGRGNLDELEKRLEEFMSSRTPTEVSDLTEQKTLQFPEGTFPILSLSPDNFWRIEAEVYLMTRKLDPKDYLICIEGEYKNRIVIPYYDSQGKLIYWNTRFLTESTKVAKYRGPSKECGIGKSDVIYMASSPWPDAGEKVFMTEGELDAKSIYFTGLFAGAIGGKSIEEKQIALLKPYIPVLCFDTDFGKKVDAGGEALLEIGDKLKAFGFEKVHYVRPPVQVKDWNEMLVKMGPKILRAYIEQQEREYTIFTSMELKTKRMN